MVYIEAFNFLIQESCDDKREGTIKVAKHPNLTLEKL
jgi:hypothetical protein